MCAAAGQAGRRAPRILRLPLLELGPLSATCSRPSGREGASSTLSPATGVGHGRDASTVNETRLAGVSLNTAFGVPAAAQISSKVISDPSIKTIGGVAWKMGCTPPIVKPVAARTKSASARPIGSPTTLSTSFSSMRLTPDATMSKSGPKMARHHFDHRESASGQPVHPRHRYAQP